MSIGRVSLIVFSFATIFSIGLAPNPAYAQSTLYGIAFIGPNGLSQLYTINTTTGVATPVGSGIGFERCSAMDFDPSTGILYALCERDAGDVDVEVLITINLITGVGSEVGPTTTPDFGAFAGMSFRNSDGVVYALLDQGFAHDMFTVNIGTGQATDLSAGSIGSSGNAVAFSSGDTLYLAATSSLIIVNQVTGGVVGTPVVNINVNRINGMDFDPDTGVLFGIHNEGAQGTNRSLVTIDVSDFSLLTSVGIIDGMDAIAFLPEDEFEECFVHVEWDNPTNLPPESPPTIPLLKDDNCVPSTGFHTILPTLTCTGSGPAICTVIIPNFIDELDRKIIEIEITFDSNQGGPPPQPAVVCHDNTGNNNANQVGVYITETQPDTIIYELECLPNPDWEEIQIQLDTNVQKIQIWTTSFDDIPIGGTYIPIDQSALLLAGVQSISMWMIPVVIAGIGIGIFVIKRRK